MCIVWFIIDEAVHSPQVPHFGFESEEVMGNEHTN